MNKDDNICDECYECYYYWQNNDDIYNCQGSKEKCHEFNKLEN